MVPPKNPMKRHRPVKPKKQNPAGPKCPFCTGPLKSSKAIEGATILLCQPCRKAGLDGLQPDKWVSTDDDKQCAAQLRQLADDRKKWNEILTSDGRDPRWTALWID